MPARPAGFSRARAGSIRRRRWLTRRPRRRCGGEPPSSWRWRSGVFRPSRILHTALTSDRKDEACSRQSGHKGDIHMRRGFGLIGLVVTAILLTIVGVIAYSLGWSNGVATHLPAGTAVAPPYYYGYGPQWGFGIFGFFWFLFVLFILFGL